jgi:diaminohydroxyphosphoribosylaminopyrimidine deaminase/5-amino-6-(5-phosphoribosylamino)uracil reductase
VILPARRSAWTAGNYFIPMNFLKPDTAADQAFMTKALALADAVKGKTFPNPAVGAVITVGGRIVGKGATRRVGGHHAEKVALAQAGPLARDATIYVTLEPCCHFGRTLPCTDALINAGIKRVVVAVRDPNPLVCGKGIARLRRAGMAVEVGVCFSEAATLNEEFFWAVTRKQAWVTLKLAMTLDGRIADSHGDSRWITGPQALRFAHELRRVHAAVAVGRKTIERDDPQLTVRHKKGFLPARIVFSSRPLSPGSTFFSKQAAQARSIVVMKGGKAGTRRDPVSGIEFWHTGERYDANHLAAFLRMAFENDITSVLVEGGAGLASSFLEHGQVNRLYIMYGNKLFGRGLDGFSFLKGLPVDRCIHLKDHTLFSLGDTVGITGIPYRKTNVD